MTSAHADPYAPDGTYAWFRLAISILLSTLGGAGIWAVVVVLPAVQADFGVDRADASISYTFTMLGFAAGNVFVGRWVDRWGIVWPVIGSAAALSAGFALAGLSTGIWTFSLAQGLLVGAGTGATFGPLIADLSHWFNKRRGIAVAAAACGNYLAGALWPTFIKWSLGSTDWRSTYFMIAAICIVAMIPLALMLRRPAPESAKSSDMPASENSENSKPAVAAFAPTPADLCGARLLRRHVHATGAHRLLLRRPRLRGCPWSGHAGDHGRWRGSSAGFFPVSWPMP